MKQFSTIIFIGLLAMIVGSCSSLKPVNYADREWHISDYYGQIIDKDTTYRMTFGDVLIPQEMAIISCADSATKYPGMERFIADILKTAGLQNDEVLFYSPAHGKIFVRLTNEPPAKRPSSLTSNMQCLTLDKDNERPYTMWVYDDDVEDWIRRPGEMYTYTYFDKKKQRVLVVDIYDYGETPIAQIFVTQSRNKMTDKMQLPTQKQLWDFSKHRLKDYERDVEFWSHRIEWHRDNAFANYKIGQEQLKKKATQYNSLIGKADSCFIHQNFELAHRYSLRWLFARIKLYPDWYSDQIEKDSDLQPLHTSPKWSTLCDTLQSRKIFSERNYEHALKERLDSIHYRDQIPRHAYLSSLRTAPQDSMLVKLRLMDMQRNDSINQIEVFDILERYGWPSSEIVGSSNFAIWEVIQHTSLDAIEKYLPLFRKAATDGELNKSFVAMMEDRCDMWRGRPQKYGTQLIRNGNGDNIPYSLLDDKKVDEWRNEMDLSPLYEYLKQMNDR